MTATFATVLAGDDHSSGGSGILGLLLILALAWVLTSR